MDAFVNRHLQGVSRTYAIVVPMLPAPLAERVGLAYLLMRIVDTIEDDTHLTTNERLATFAHLEAALQGQGEAAEALTRIAGDTPDERRLQQDAPEVLRRINNLPPTYREPIFACARAMSAGVRALVSRSAAREAPYPAVQNLAELREYCYYVAGVVGEMLCELFTEFLHEPALRDRRQEAVELGLGLQLVNILKDARADSVHGRRYLPSVTGDQSHGRTYHEALHEARRCLARGVDYVLAIPRAASDVRRFCGLPIAWGAQTLNRAAEDETKAKIDRAAITASIARFDELAADDAGLRGWLTDLIAARDASAPAGGVPDLNAR